MQCWPLAGPSWCSPVPGSIAKAVVSAPSISAQTCLLIVSGTEKLNPRVVREPGQPGRVGPEGASLPVGIASLSDIVKTFPTLVAVLKKLLNAAVVCFLKELYL